MSMLDAGADRISELEAVMDLQRENAAVRKQRIAELEAECEQKELVCTRLRLSWREDTASERQRAERAEAERAEYVRLYESQNEAMMEAQSKLTEAEATIKRMAWKLAEAISSLVGRSTINVEDWISQLESRWDERDDR